MASKSTAQWASTSPYVTLTITESASDATSVTLAYKLTYTASSAANTINSKDWSITIADEVVASGSYDIDGRTGTSTIKSGTKKVYKGTSEQRIICGASFAFNMSWSGVSTTTRICSLSYTIPKMTSYKVTYNANGGSLGSVPSSQTKWHSTTLTLTSYTPTRTGYTFAGWGTSSTDTSVDYAAGATYSSNKSITLYAIWKANTYKVTYNANGGSLGSVPSSQTKTYGVTLKLSTAKPTRTNYTFIGWGTSTTDTTVDYAAGATYSTNKDITLYAIWEWNYTRPRITNLSVRRCISTSNTESNDDGTYAYVQFGWACDRPISSITITVVDSSGDETSTSVTASGTSGNVSKVVGGSLYPEKAYRIDVCVKDATANSYASANLYTKKFVIDCLAGGNGVAFGKAAERSGYAEFGFGAVFNGTVRGNAFGLSTLPSIPSGEDLNSYLTPGVYGIASHAIAGSLANNPAGAMAGRLIVCAATGGEISVAAWSYIQQWYIPMTFTVTGTNAIYVRTITREPNKAPNYYSWLKFTGTSV